MKKLLVLLLCCFVPIVSLADSFRVYDNADLFTPEEEVALENAIKEYRWETKTDFAILTTDDFLGTDNQLIIANGFYDAMGFGITMNKDGMLFYIDMNTRTHAISTCGSVMTLMSSNRLDEMFDTVTPLLSDGEYSRAMHAAIQKALDIYTEYWQTYIPE